MSVVLQAIVFNHDPASAETNALNLRKDALEFVNLPEWQRGLSVNPRDSVAAYAINPTHGNTITIQAKLATTDPDPGTIEVRAIDPGPRIAPVSLFQRLVDPRLFFVNPQFYNSLFQSFLREFRPLPNNILGEVESRKVTFGPNAETGFETFRLQNVRIWGAGVGVNNIRWRWQFRRDSRGQWIDFAESLHKIYTVLDIPTLPWLQQPYDVRNTQLPWTDVLDFACRWAFGAQTIDEAATRVTRALNDLGPELFQYECRGMGGSHYTTWPLNSFDCSRFIERLRGGVGNGNFINCTDCATIVSTFSNILGCDLWQSRMSPNSGVQPFFALNPLMAIGSRVFAQPCGWPGFVFHEVAWKGACTANEQVFDACVHVESDLNPFLAPGIPLLPTNMRFGFVGEGEYRDHLASPPGRVHCQPHPETRQRRFVR